MSTEISSSDNTIDSRDVIERIEEIESECADDSGDFDSTNLSRLGYREEYDALKALQERAEGYSDWQHGETLIRDSYFEDYAREYAEDIGAIDPNASWPLAYIDWEAAADALIQDYTSVEFDGVTYWVR